MCEYCEGKEDISNKIFEDGSKFSDYMVRVWIDKVFDNEVLLVSPVEYENGERKQYMRYTFYINYCPMCGRKLVEDGRKGGKVMTKEQKEAIKSLDKFTNTKYGIFSAKEGQTVLSMLKEIIKYDELKDNLKRIRNAYSNLGKLEHKRAEKFNPDSVARHNCIDRGNEYINFANSITNLLNGENIENILEYINIPLKYLEED